MIAREKLHGHRTMTELSKESKKEKRERKKEKEAKAKVKKEKSEGPKRSAEKPESERPSGEHMDQPEQLIEPTSSAGGAEAELEIDLNAAVPLSRKKQRLLKKGKLNLDKIARKNPPPKPLTQDGDEPQLAPEKSKYGVWVGNLSFDTTKDDLIQFVVSETQGNQTGNQSGHVPVQRADITRVNLPKKNDKIKGFAYLDFASEQHLRSVIALSERSLNGRNLLIKDATSFEGRPQEHLDKTKPLLKNPPSRILFVGNLSFDTTDDLLEEHFKPCGKITKIRMATFEDSGKCKGFAFIDFVDDLGPTAALNSKLLKTFINRPLRLEYGEDRSKRNPKKLEAEARHSRESPALDGPREPRQSHQEDRQDRNPLAFAPEQPGPDQRPKRSVKRPAERTSDPNKRLKSSIALATAQRQSMAIVPSQGKKVKFD